MGVYFLPSHYLLFENRGNNVDQIPSLIIIGLHMTNKADLERVFFHNYQKHSRLNNPTFVSNFVNDSLTLFTPQKVEKQEAGKATEYKSSFQPLNDKMNVMSLSPHYHKYSKQAFQRSRSYLSSYGTNLLSQDLSKVGRK